MIHLRQLPWLLLLVAVATSATARDKDHFSVKLGTLQHENPAYDPAINLGLTVGGKLMDGKYLSLGLQLEINTSVVEGETSTVRKDWEMDTHALYTSLYIGERHYLKLKAGYSDWQVRYDTEAERNGNGLSWGVGYGYPLDNGRTLELEYTLLSDDEDYGINYISLGYYF
ncbi:outer membrane beta-barrel protein [Thiohalophilus sp.]|uniref:outer membrane beta-barrel protein n=1 Tax=Thiohalophilus sp. TaxID=3028392 RepID=UPI002ACE60F5|nr:outer membrane beta-barrel protein [Thiohalophilus sp.]MDZ7803814.1 outer membrane beta-barrel protein [Thiohalophilus sp.]